MQFIYAKGFKIFNWHSLSALGHIIFYEIGLKGIVTDFLCFFDEASFIHVLHDVKFLPLADSIRGRSRV